MVVATAILARAGVERRWTLPVPIETTGPKGGVARTASQALAAALTSARRQLKMMIGNVTSSRRPAEAAPHDADALEREIAAIVDPDDRPTAAHVRLLACELALNGGSVGDLPSPLTKAAAMAALAGFRDMRR
jgi:hypothetical protein